MQHAAAQAAWKHVHADALVAGISRSQASWQAVINSVLPILSTLDISFPGLELMRQLPQKARYGFISATATELHSGGLLTYMTSSYSLLPWFLYVQTKPLILRP